MLLQEITSAPAIQTQTTITENIRETIQEHETRSKEDYIRQQVIRLAHLHLQCNPFIV